jgi:hypothetical protein
MRNATRNIRHEVGDAHGRSDGLIVGAVLCAALMVAILALHGGPDLLGGQFDAGLIVSPSR